MARPAKAKKENNGSANPPFNISDWGGDHLREDVRLEYGLPPVGNANYGWLQHIVHHLAPNGTAGVVLANGSMSSNQSVEGDISCPNSFRATSASAMLKNSWRQHER